MVLWTLQPQEVYDIIEKRGVYYPCRNLIDWKEFEPAYKWMVGQMNERMYPSPQKGSFPVWAWYQYNNGKNKKPRISARGHAERGSLLYRLTLEVEEKDVLLSDFSLWHFVLNNFYLATSEKAYAIFERREKEMSRKEIRTEIERSWGKIFDIDRPEPREKRSIQGTLWSIDKSQIKKVEKFIAK